MITYTCIASLIQQFANSTADKSAVFLSMLHTLQQHAAVIFTRVLGTKPKKVIVVLTLQKIT
jgi:hypothetical protein